MTGLAAVSGAVGVTGASALAGVNDRLEKAAQQFIVERGRVTGDDNGGQDPGGRAPGAQDPGGNDGKGHNGGERAVPCDPDELIAALVHANAGNGASLKLAERCTYTLTAFAPVVTPPGTSGPNGLPIITKPITIKGEGATIVRAANAEPFRILEVGVGGNLRLRDVTIKGGSATVAGGGGIRVSAGGEATLEHINVVHNRAAGAGGGIANFGITKISGKTDYGNDSPSTGAPSPEAPSTGAPSPEAPSPGAPSPEVPSPEAPSPGAPSTGVPSPEAPSPGVPSPEVPSTGAPSTGVPSPEVPNTEAPSTEAPSTEAPSNGPAAQAPGGQGAAAEPPAENTGTDKNWDDKDKGGHEGNGNTISNNSAVLNGGGIHNNGYLTVENTRLSYNVVRTSGGIAITGNGGGVSNGRVAVLDDVRIDHNLADFRGGGVLGGINSTTTVTNADISDNTASNEGGGIFSDGDFHLKHSKVDRNSVFQRGGGIFNQIGQFVIEDSRISENIVRNEHGGGIFVGTGTVVLLRTHVERNKAVGPNSQAGGIYNRGTLSLTESKVVQNDSTLPPGGIFTNNNLITVDQNSLIIKNRPTNCTGSDQPVPNCFG
ncbi:hypothetical protein JOD64_006057 [Micromonospora luteifusca]|uniref:Right-handed parallel beta-helix repeat-containing protein n=1 Tax=Micromonospora luteifusca TaxID=709860 RepID=A0ABS2M2Z9_9ACTN|nr:hypothetical protein [Micromonospora luteifusca]